MTQSIRTLSPSFTVILAGRLCWMPGLIGSISDANSESDVSVGTRP
jgi:hypothetical protein